MGGSQCTTTDGGGNKHRVISVKALFVEIRQCPRIDPLKAETRVRFRVGSASLFSDLDPARDVQRPSYTAQIRQRRCSRIVALTSTSSAKATCVNRRSPDRSLRRPILRPSMTQARRIVNFSDQFVGAVECLLASPLSDSRRKLLKLVLVEWSRTDLAEHLSRKPRATIKKRLNRTETVKELALQLSKALAALDSEDQIAVAHLIERQYRVSRAELSRQQNRLLQGSRFVADLAAIAPENFWKPTTGPHASTVAAYLVLQDAAAIFEWLTGTAATRAVGRISGSDSSPFFHFASILWPVVFGKGITGLKSAMKNWAKWRKEHRERSALMTNIALRHPTWRISKANP